MPGPSAIPNKPGKTNWVEEQGGLPKYIERIASELHKGGMPVAQAIATAVNTVKRWAAGGTVRANGGPRVKADTQAQARAALAEWNAKKAKATKSKAPFDMSRTSFNVDKIRSAFEERERARRQAMFKRREE